MWQGKGISQKSKDKLWVNWQLYINSDIIFVLDAYNCAQLEYRWGNEQMRDTNKCHIHILSAIDLRQRQKKNEGSLYNIEHTYYPGQTTASSNKPLGSGFICSAICRENRFAHAQFILARNQREHPKGHLRGHLHKHTSEDHFQRHKQANFLHSFLSSRSSQMKEHQNIALQFFMSTEKGKLTQNREFKDCYLGRTSLS